MDADLNTLVTALYVQVDDLLKANPDRVPWRPPVGIAPRISDAELVTLAVAQALLGFTSEARWLRFGRPTSEALFPYLPGQPGYNKRLRKLVGTLSWLIRALGTRTSMFGDDVWIADSTPVECGRSRETAKRSDLAGFAEYGYCASHSRATSGGCGCTCCARCTDCRSRPRSPAPKPMNATCCWACSTTPTWPTRSPVPR